MLAYALVEVGDQEAIDLFLSRDEAEAALEECIRDEPQWQSMLRIVKVELQQADLSQN